MMPDENNTFPFDNFQLNTKTQFNIVSVNRLVNRFFRLLFASSSCVLLFTLKLPLLLGSVIFFVWSDSLFRFSGSGVGCSFLVDRTLLFPFVHSPFLVMSSFLV